MVSKGHGIIFLTLKKFFFLYTPQTLLLLLKTYIQESIRKFYGLVSRISYDSKIISIYETVNKLAACSTYLPTSKA